MDEFGHPLFDDETMLRLYNRLNVPQPLQTYIASVVAEDGST